MPRIDAAKNREYQRRWYEKNKKTQQARTAVVKKRRALWFAELKSQYKCDQCPENHPACIDFHHVDKANKIAPVCLMVAKGLSRASILAEIAKCRPLCSNCHRKHHWKERQVMFSSSSSSGSSRRSGKEDWRPLSS